MPEIADVRVWRWDVPMHAPYRSAQRITAVAHNVLVRITLADGTEGWGESAPATYVTGETQDTVAAAVESIAPSLVGRDAASTAVSLPDRLPGHPGAYGSLEMALLDALSRVNNVPLYQYLGGPADIPPFRETDVSFPILSPSEAAARATGIADTFRAVKIKVGGPDPDTDEARIRAIAEAAPRVKLRLDGNQGFSASGAIALARRLEDLHPRIEMFEQPTPAGDDAAMAEVQRNLPFPVFADESVHCPDSATRLVRDGACQGVVLKLAKSGIRGTLAMALATCQAGGRCLFGCMMETRVGITAALHLALALGPQTTPFLDLDGHMLVNDTGLVHGGLTQTGDRLHIDPSLPGLGITACAVS